MTDLKKHAVPGILLASFLLRAAYAFYSGNGFGYPDEAVHHNLALAMLSGPDWGGLFHSREPLYPLLIWLTYKVTGPLPLAVKLLQAALSCGGAYLLYRTSRDLFGGRAALLTLLIFAFYPFSVFYDARLLRESLLSFLGIAVMHFSLKPCGGKGPCIIAASALCGLAAMAKTIFMFYWLPFIAAALLLRKVSPGAALASAAAFTLAVSPLCMYNYKYTGKIFLTRGQMFNLYTSLVVPKEVLGSPQEDAIVGAHPVLKEGMSLPEADAFFTARVKEEMRSRPLNFAQRSGWRFLKLWRLYPHRGIDYSAGSWLLLTAVSLLSDGWLIPLGLWAAIRLRSRIKELYPLYIFIGSFTVIYALSWSQMRYRLPLMPAVILLCSPVLLEFITMTGVKFPAEETKKC
ncbi:MAG: glycosyltransferase family 39 protein [Elusimicrobia bacterium]|nr:glycosyltransferase family 39 protein [Elusimicrobiota bacterium]